MRLPVVVNQPVFVRGAVGGIERFLQAGRQDVAFGLILPPQRRQGERAGLWVCRHSSYSGVFGKKYPPAASKMPAGVQPCCAFFLAFGHFLLKKPLASRMSTHPRQGRVRKNRNAVIQQGRLKTCKTGFQTAFCQTARPRFAGRFCQRKLRRRKQQTVF